ncbi:MAG: FMN-binding protein [Spirochaetales bacterium]|nr:FMN-binding protein [Spirochaetales bacterium]
MKKRILAGILALIVIIIAAAVLFVSGRVKKFTTFMETVRIEQPDLDEIPDGIYHAETNVFPIIVELSVEIKAHRITGIDLVRHMNGKGGDAERILDEVMAKQSLRVDTVSGATFSSKVILATIQKALE